MTHWHIYNTFERFIFLCGYISLFATISIIICLIWDRVERKRKARQRARQKKKASKPIDHITFTYDCEGRIKQDRAELAELMKRGGKRDVYIHKRN